MTRKWTLIGVILLGALLSLPMLDRQGIWFDEHSDDVIDYHHFRGMELWLVSLEQSTAVSE